MIRTVSFRSGPNADATITILGQPGFRHRVYGVLWSYSAEPTSGRIYSRGLWSGDDFDLDILVGGPGELSFPPVEAESQRQVSVTLTAGGEGVIGKVSVFYSTE